MSDLDSFFDEARKAGREELRKTHSLEEKILWQLLRTRAGPGGLAGLRRAAQGDLTLSWFAAEYPGFPFRIGCTMRAWRADIPAIGFMRKFPRSNLFKAVSKWSAGTGCQLRTELWMFVFRWGRQLGVVHNSLQQPAHSHFCYVDTERPWRLYLERFADFAQAFQGDW